MSAEVEETPAAEEKASGLLGAVERIGNKVPHPVLMFAYLIVFVIVLSWGLSLAGVSITEQIAVPVDQAAPDYDYYEDTTQPGLTPGTPPYDEDWTIIEETIPLCGAADLLRPGIDDQLCLYRNILQDRLTGHTCSPCKILIT